VVCVGCLISWICFLVLHLDIRTIFVMTNFALPILVSMIVNYFIFRSLIRYLLDTMKNECTLPGGLGCLSCNAQASNMGKFNSQRETQAFELYLWNSLTSSFLGITIHKLQL
jgi:hypothetical protein